VEKIGILNKIKQYGSNFSAIFLFYSSIKVKYILSLTPVENCFIKIKALSSKKVFMKSTLLIFCVLFFSLTILSQSFVKEYSSGKKLYEWDGKCLKAYNSGKKLCELSGPYLRDYSSGKKLFEYDGTNFKDYSSGKKLYLWDGKYLKTYSSGRKLYELDGSYLKNYSSGKKLYEIDGIVPKSIITFILIQ